MALRCLSRYRSVGRGVYAEAGEILRDISPDLERELLDDAPGCFAVYEPEVEPADKAMDAPPQHRMVEREKVARRASERKPAGVMSKADHPGLTGS